MVRAQESHPSKKYGGIIARTGLGSKALSVRSYPVVVCIDWEMSGNVNVENI